MNDENFEPTISNAISKEQKEIRKSLRSLISVLKKIRNDINKTEEYIDELICNTGYYEINKLFSSFLNVIIGDDRYTFGYAYYKIGTWINRYNHFVVVDVAGQFSNKESVDYSLWYERVRWSIDFEYRCFSFENYDHCMKSIYNIICNAECEMINLNMNEEHPMKISFENYASIIKKQCLDAIFGRSENEDDEIK